MQLFSTLLVASAALVSAVLARGPIDVFNGVTPSDSAELISWPGDAAAFRLRRRTGLTNAQRIQRGLTPSRPRKLYQAKVDSGLAKRVADPVPQAQGSAGINIYNFVNCYSALDYGNGFDGYRLTYTDNQDFANQCARLQDSVNSTPGAFQSFILIDRPFDNNCYVSVGGQAGGEVTCAAGDGQGAVYALSPP